MIFAHADYERERKFSADVVVIGTGAGGASAGAELAAAGHDVVFVEEGGHHPTSSFNPYITETIPRLYRDASATVIAGKPPIPFVEGRCVGGSTVINGGMAYRPPDRVLADWEKIAPELGARALEPYFESVENRVSVAPQHPDSIGEDSRMMQAGAKRMGWSFTVNQRNQRSCVGSNNCTMGCPTGAKQSTLVTYIPDALAAGARCLTEVRVERLLIEGGRAVGVVGRSVNPRTRKLDRPVEVRARAVIVACGAIQTPLLLLRQKLGRPGRQLGKNFTCHPNAKVLPIYPSEQCIEGWKGVSQAAQIREFHDEGILFAENFVPPGVMAAYMPFHGDEIWEAMSNYNQSIMSGVLVEDSTTGRVSRLPFGAPLIRYDITKLDHERFLRGIKLLAEMHFVMGADRVILPFFNQHLARSVDDLKKIDVLQTCPSTLELFTPHLMGTARMGSDARGSVVDVNGELWDLPGCYIADASLFPTAIGVNPQITIMALAKRVAQHMSLAKQAA